MEEIEDFEVLDLDNGSQVDFILQSQEFNVPPNSYTIISPFSLVHSPITVTQKIS